MARETNKRSGDSATTANRGFEARYAERDTQKAEGADPKGMPQHGRRWAADAISGGAEL